MEERNLYDKSKFFAAVCQFFLVVLISKLFICFVEDIYFFHPHVSILQSAAVNDARKDVIFVIIEN